MCSFGASEGCNLNEGIIIARRGDVGFGTGQAVAKPTQTLLCGCSVRMLFPEVETSPSQYDDVIFKHWGYIIITAGLFCPS